MARDKSKKVNTNGDNNDLKTIVEEEAEAYPSIISSFFNWLNGSQSDTTLMPKRGFAISRWTR